MRYRTILFGLSSVAGVAGCGTSSNTPPDTVGSPVDGGGSDGSGGGVGVGTSLPPSGSGSRPSLLGDANLEAAPPLTGDPQTCAQAVQAHSYIGCDYWPTVVSNNVWSIFDFTVVVANAGQSTANITVTGPSNTNQTAMVAPGQLAKIYLPWVPALKGPDSDTCGSASGLASSVKAVGGAFHLVSSVPVTVYQFNALEYKGQGGPPGKSWAACPGNNACNDPNSPNFPATSGCYSFTNDASLLLPSTAMTGHYRVAGHGGILAVNPRTGQPVGALNGYMAITGTADATTVTVKVAAGSQILAGTGIPATSGGGTLSLTLGAGDVAELIATNGSDISGSVVQATAPVQLITGHPCFEIPPTQPACDHMEESVFPAETWGKDYVVTQPAGPNGNTVPHQVRFYGNFDNTHLTYNPPTPPPNCPTTLNAGQVVECGVGGACPITVDPTQMYSCGETSQDFEVTGDQPFAVGTFTLGASVVDPSTQPPNQKGDPAQSFVTAVEQYRLKYVFLAPDDYPVNYVDIVAKTGTTLTLDGQTPTATPQAIGTSGYTVSRVQLGGGQAGAHMLTASQPVGIQVVGYGSYTSYMYPGGLDLQRIAPPPQPIL
jgi:hypothetical protein